MAQDGLAAFEPAYADEVATIMEWALDYVQRDGSGDSEIEWLRDVEGGSVYLRLSTRAIAQPKRQIDKATRHGVMAGGYWLRAPAPGAEIAIAYTGAVAPEALEAWEQLNEESPGAGLLAVTSADRLGAGWHAAERARQHGEGMGARSHVERLLEPLAPGAGIVTVTDGHPEALTWIGGVFGHRIKPLGVEHFGQSGTIADLFRHYRIDADAILDACAAALVSRHGVRQVPKAAE
jgi:pyruvate dehydrogenase E1 component